MTKTNSKSDLKKSNFPKQSPSSFLSKYPVVCSKHAVAGIGLLTDHGIRDHGWMTNNEQQPIDVAIARIADVAADVANVVVVAAETVETATPVV